MLQYTFILDNGQIDNLIGDNFIQVLKNYLSWAGHNLLAKNTIKSITVTGLYGKKVIVSKSTIADIVETFLAQNKPAGIEFAENLEKATKMAAQWSVPTLKMKKPPDKPLPKTPVKKEDLYKMSLKQLKNLPDQSFSTPEFWKNYSIANEHNALITVSSGSRSPAFKTSKGIIIAKEANNISYRPIILFLHKRGLPHHLAASIFSDAIKDGDYEFTDKMLKMDKEILHKFFSNFVFKGRANLEIMQKVLDRYDDQITDDAISESVYKNDMNFKYIKFFQSQLEKRPVLNGYIFNMVVSRNIFNEIPYYLLNFPMDSHYMMHSLPPIIFEGENRLMDKIMDHPDITIDRTITGYLDSKDNNLSDKITDQLLNIYYSDIFVTNAKNNASNEVLLKDLQNDPSPYAIIGAMPYLIKNGRDEIILEILEIPEFTVLAVHPKVIPTLLSKENKLKQKTTDKLFTVMNGMQLESLISQEKSIDEIETFLYEKIIHKEMLYNILVKLVKEGRNELMNIFINHILKHEEILLFDTDLYELVTSDENKLQKELVEFIIGIYNANVFIQKSIIENEPASNVEKLLDEDPLHFKLIVYITMPEFIAKGKNEMIKLLINHPKFDIGMITGEIVDKLNSKENNLKDPQLTARIQRMYHDYNESPEEHPDDYKGISAEKFAEKSAEGSSEEESSDEEEYEDGRGFITPEYPRGVKIPNIKSFYEEGEGWPSEGPSEEESSEEEFSEKSVKKSLRECLETIGVNVGK